MGDSYTQFSAFLNVSFILQYNRVAVGFRIHLQHLKLRPSDNLLEPARLTHKTSPIREKEREGQRDIKTER